MNRQRVSKERIAGTLVFVLAVYAMVSIVANALLLSIQSGAPYVPANPLAAGTTAPTFELKSLKGETVTLAQFKDRPVLLMFWGTS